MSHPVIQRLIPLAMLLGLLLSRTASAQEPKVIAKARTVGNPVVMAIAHNGEGRVLDRGNAESIAALFADTEWTVFDNGELLITKKGKPVLGWYVVRANTTILIFWIHVREDKSLVDGEIWIFDDKMGYGQLFWTIWSEDGRSSVTANVSTRLNFAP
jgi:hypothetical protein